jgi:hypothetical protein
MTRDNKPEATSKLAIDTQHNNNKDKRYPTTTTTRDTWSKQASKQASYNKFQHNNSQESRLQRRGHRGEQKWQQQRTLSKISQLLLEMYINVFTILFFHNNKTNQTKPNQKKKKPQVQIPKMHAKDVIHTPHTHSQVFFFGTIVFGPFFVFVDKRKIGKIVELFFCFVFLTVNLTNLAPLLFLENFVKF